MKKKTFVYQIEVRARPSEEKEDALALKLLEQALDDATYYLFNQINEIEECLFGPMSESDLKQIRRLKKTIKKYIRIKESINLIEVKE